MAEPGRLLVPRRGRPSLLWTCSHGCRLHLAQPVHARPVRRNGDLPLVDLDSEHLLFALRIHERAMHGGWAPHVP